MKALTLRHELGMRAIAFPIRRASSDESLPTPTL